MVILEARAFPVAEFYLGFFGMSLILLLLIVLSGLPGLIRKCSQAVRQIKARKLRSSRMIANLDDLERAGASLEGATLFEEDEVFS